MISLLYYYIDAEIYIFYENLISTTQAGLFFLNADRHSYSKKHKDVIGGFICVVNVYGVFFASS
ncbi:putative membrane protein [Escherichia coli 3-373-03_S4_C3]|nr:putative membrane protein [Escherichia coli 3-373-03_S4_C2]KDU47187.1 putative membrane protein [Escherichia coli 3-373-03_S4_C1]KEL20302.1 putative membrane protein [Escherichia coli 3-373-03_S4_C3]